MDKNVIRPKDRITWVLDDLIKHGEVRTVHEWGITAYADGSPRTVQDHNGVVRPFFYSVEFNSILAHTKSACAPY